MAHDINSSFWTPMGTIVANATSGNDTIDVLRKNCLNNFDTIACVRVSVLNVFCAITAVFCAWQIIQHHRRAGGRSSHKLSLLYVIIIHLLVGACEWALGWTTQVSLACSYLRSLEMLILCHYFLNLTSHMLKWSADTSARLSVFTLAIVFIYLTVFVVLGLVHAVSPWLDCFAMWWLWLSGGHVVIAVIMLCTCVAMCRRIRLVSADDTIKSAQLTDLFCLTGIYQLSAWLELIAHLILFLLADADTGCSGVFNHRQEVYSPVKLTYEMLVYLAPIWVTLWVFGRHEENEVDSPPQHSTEDGSSIPGLNPANYPQMRVHSSGRLSQQMLYNNAHSTNSTSQSNSPILEPVIHQPVILQHVLRASSQGIVHIGRHGSRIIRRVRALPHRPRANILSNTTAHPSLHTIHETDDSIVVDMLDDVPIIAPESI